MLQTGMIHEGDEMLMLDLTVRGSDRLPMVFQFWLAEVARDHLRLAVYFRAVGIMLQVPGAAAYRCVCEDDGLDDESWELARCSSRKTLVDVLAHCLDGLGAGDLIKQVPGGEDYPWGERELPDEWKALVEKSLRIENGLLNLIAGCLDELVVKPGMAEIDQGGQRPWWQRWRLRPE